MAKRRRRLSKQKVDSLIHCLLEEKHYDYEKLLKFAEEVNGEAFKISSLSMKEAKHAVLTKFSCKNATELRKNKNFQLAFAGEKVGLRSTADWLKQYRKWIGVPKDERNSVGDHCINGINILENFRPWHVFGLSSETATSEDIKQAFRKLAKTYHPDVGGNGVIFEKLQKMRDSMLAFVN